MLNHQQTEEQFTGNAVISYELFSLFSCLIYRVSGIRLAPSKKGLVSSRLTKRLLKCGIADYYDYYRRVKEDSG